MIDIDESNIRRVDLNLLVAFDALYDSRSVTRAAERLSLTQPTVSGMLARLRDMFDDPLFLRSSHGIVPTARADALSGPVRRWLLDAKTLLQPERFDPAEEEFTVSLSGSDYHQRANLGRFLTAIRHKAPKARVSVLPRPADGVAEKLARGEFDLVLAIRDILLPGLPALRLYTDRYVCVARKPHPHGQTRLGLRELCQYPHAFVDPSGGTFRGPIDAALEHVGARRHVVAAVPNFAMLFDLLAQDDLLAFVPERVLHGRDSGLRRFDTELAPPPIEVFANWHPRFDKDPRHIWLRETLVESVGELQDGAD